MYMESDECSCLLFVFVLAMLLVIALKVVAVPIAGGLPAAPGNLSSRKQEARRRWNKRHAVHTQSTDVFACELEATSRTILKHI